jgi:hypothetical protein
MRNSWHTVGYCYRRMGSNRAQIVPFRRRRAGGRPHQWRIDGGVGGGSNPPLTGPTKIFSIEFNMVYLVLCVIHAVSLAQ